MDVEDTLEHLRDLLILGGLTEVVTEIDEECVIGPTGLDEGRFRVKWKNGEQCEIVVGGIYNPLSPLYIK